ncbi:hypothetical protein Zmor_000974 [Zophobas morio]|uniref:Deltamethrin resistance protein prag01 domain-containing protein n=1 Tax=Zophobas morio TaxID=2755281 RepID=A0AA38MR67_9CUCU|nr:hypothetical protein Zmor_000974 [Zophobas morio]
MQAPRLLRSSVIKQIRRNYTESGLAKTTINDLPSPQGSWQTQNDANQRKFNAQLIGGIGLLTGTIIFGKAIGYLEFHNDLPKPADIPSYK